MEVLDQYVVQPQEAVDLDFTKKFPFYTKLSQMSKEEYVAWVEKVQALYLPKFDDTTALEYTLQKLQLADGPAPQPQDWKGSVVKQLF